MSVCAVLSYSGECMGWGGHYAGCLNEFCMCHLVCLIVVCVCVWSAKGVCVRA